MRPESLQVKGGGRGGGRWCSHSEASLAAAQEAPVPDASVVQRAVPRGTCTHLHASTPMATRGWYVDFLTMAVRGKCC